MDDLEKDNLNPDGDKNENSVGNENTSANTEETQNSNFDAQQQNNQTGNGYYQQNGSPNNGYYQNNNSQYNNNGYSNSANQQFNGQYSNPYNQPPVNNPYNPPRPFDVDPEAANPINYSNVEKPTENSQSKKGLKIFCIILACAILLSGGCFAGYMAGKSGNPKKNLYSKVEVDLAAKPKDTDEETAAQVYEKVSPSVVGIRVYNKQAKVSQASGVIYSEDGYVITNDHIYAQIGAPQFKIYMQDGTEYDADYVAGDMISDLAVLKIKDGKNLVPAVLGNSEEIYCGQNVAAIGRPSDATISSNITKGIISLTKRRMRTASNYSASLIQTDSAINPGSSGGALVNMYGQVIGITAAKIQGYDRIGFAIPTTTVKRVAEQLIEKGKVTDRAKLGISYKLIDSVAAQINDMETTGLYVAEVTADSDLHGKLKKGDVITHIDGVEIKDDDTVLDMIDARKAGDTITLSVKTEGGEQKELKAALKANVGTSSYSEKIIEENPGKNPDKNPDKNGGDTFDFPFGE